MGKIGKNSRGRPDVQTVKKNREACEDAFNKGWPVLYAAEQIPLDRHTVSNYYIEFREKLVESMDKNFVNEQKTSKYFAMKELRAAIAEVELIMKDAYEKKNDKTNVWHTTILHCIELKASLNQAMHSLGMTPTIDIDVQNVVTEAREIATKLRDNRVKTE